MTEFLITGVSSGLGRHLVRKLGGIGITRDNMDRALAELGDKRVETIVHCAATGRLVADGSGPLRACEDNILLTRRILEIPHDRFVFLSSVDVYPDESTPMTEDMDLTHTRPRNVYGASKLFAESLVLHYGQKPLVLRCTSLIGSGMRPNNLTKLLGEPKPTLSLTSESELNLVTYDVVHSCIEDALSRDIDGIFNIASLENIQLGTIAERAGKEVSFGSFRYRVGNIDISKARSTFKHRPTSSWNALDDLPQLRS